MRFVYLFKIYSNRIVKVKSAFLQCGDGDTAIKTMRTAVAALPHRRAPPASLTPGNNTGHASFLRSGLGTSVTVLFLVDITSTKG
jgi:hypothetical protein